MQTSLRQGIGNSRFFSIDSMVFRNIAEVTGLVEQALCHVWSYPAGPHGCLQKDAN